VLIDGTLIPTRRRTRKDNCRNFSGKHKRQACASSRSPTNADA
jgi:hypothetical protein